MTRVDAELVCSKSRGILITYLLDHNNIDASNRRLFNCLRRFSEDLTVSFSEHEDIKVNTPGMSLMLSRCREKLRNHSHVWFHIIHPSQVKRTRKGASSFQATSSLQCCTQLHHKISVNLQIYLCECASLGLDCKYCHFKLHLRLKLFISHGWIIRIKE